MTAHTRITFLITDLNYGGAEVQVVELASRLSARGWQASVVSMLQPRAFVADLSAAGVPVRSLNMRRGMPSPRAVFDLAAILREDRPHILHSHMVHANLLARVSRLVRWTPALISTAHNIDEGSRWREIAYRLTDPICDLTTNVSQAAVERYVQVGAAPARKIRFVPNGVNVDRFRSDAEARDRLRRELGLGGRFAWLAVGRFEAAKDHLTLVRAFGRLGEQDDAALLLAGQGGMEDQIRAEVAALGLSDRVRFLGVRRDIPQLLNAADAYVMSSAWEGLPMVLLEAAAVGLVTVATAVGGNHEIVLDGRNGFLVPPRDPAALAGSMRLTMQLPEGERKRMGAAGKDYVHACYSLSRVVDQWESLYQECLSGREPRRTRIATGRE
ncbi:MAG: glycosyltransferase [Kouleothrix sp.]|nr:glycosyltransferase [Kouleothrix sp.]